MTSDSEPRERQIAGHFLLPLEKSRAYLLVARGAPVTVRSQQNRALNLAWALREDLQQGTTTVAVIGGGAAGLTFATAAAGLGAQVTLFEAHRRLMHLQDGSWHRPLHPEIYRWPRDAAFRNMSYGPFLSWASGNAHQVAQEIVGKFWDKYRRLPNLEVVHGRATIRADGKVVANRVKPPREFSIVILAVGFGIENNAFALPSASYWRADAVGQSHLWGDRAKVVCSGAGDGALMDLIRCCVHGSDDSAFYDRVLAITVKDPNLLRKIREIEDRTPDADLDAAYRDVRAEDHPDSLPELDELLTDDRDIDVTWVVQNERLFSRNSLPINRFLVSRIVELTEKEGRSRLTILRGATLSNVVLRKDRYKVTVKTPGSEYGSIDFDCRQVIARHGQETVGGDGAFASVVGAIEGYGAEVAVRVAMFLRRKEPAPLDRPLWGDDFNRFLKEVERGDGAKKRERPGLFARFVKAFERLREGSQKEVEVVFRISVWLKGFEPALSVVYELHPDASGGPVPRPAIGRRVRLDDLRSVEPDRDDHRQWVNTVYDYGIRIRASDRREWGGYAVGQALERYYDLHGWDEPIPKVTRATSGDDEYMDAGAMSAREAYDALRDQTSRFRASKRRGE